MLSGEPLPLFGTLTQRAGFDPLKFVQLHRAHKTATATGRGTMPWEGNGVWNVIVLGLASLLTDVSSEMTYPLLPLFLGTLPGVSSATVGLIVGLVEGIAESLASLIKVISGRRADKTGRRKPLAIAGYAGSTLGKLCFVLATIWPVVLLGRIIDRFGKGIRTAPRDALLADAAPPDRRGGVFGLHRFMDTLGALAGVLLAYLLLPGGADTTPRFAFNTIFLLSLIPAALGVIVLFFVQERAVARLRPGAPPADADDVATSVGSARVGSPLAARNSTAGSSAARISLLEGWRALDPKLRGFLLVALVFTLGNSSNQFLLLRANASGFDAKSVLLLYAVYNVVYAVIAYPAGRLSDRVGRRALLIAGYVCYGLVYFGFAFAGGGALWGLFAVYGAYIALTEGVEKALVTDLAPQRHRATLIGLHATIVGIGLLPASLVAGLLWSYVGPQAPFVWGGLTGLLAAAGMAYVLRRS